MYKVVNRNAKRKARHLRVRKKISGTPDKPRLNVFKSCTNIYAQIIDDTKGATLVSASTLEKDLKNTLSSTSNIEAAKAVGKLVAERALEKGIEEVAFDRGGYQYHGKVKGLAEAAREAGLKF
jgi:large subunit ribosomal protein L18